MSMTNYKRKSRPFFHSNSPTSVDIIWSQQYGAYAVKWMDTGHFQEMQPVINYMKGKPYGEYTYDPDNKIWYIAEKYIQDVLTLLNAFGDTIFKVNFVEKPLHSNMISAPVISVDTYLNNFHAITGEDISKLEYDKAKRIYRHICMQYHPDKHPEFASKMSSINEIWTILEIEHFKTRSRVSYETPSVS
jgi:hypothetical protein